MPDITMCTDAGCSDRGNCYRYLAVPIKYRQSYFAETPRPDPSITCQFITPLDSRMAKNGRPVLPVEVVDAKYNEKL